MDKNEILVTTTEHIPGHEYEIIGEVFGLTTQSKTSLRISVLGSKTSLVAKLKLTLNC